MLINHPNTRRKLALLGLLLLMLLATAGMNDGADATATTAQENTTQPPLLATNTPQGTPSRFPPTITPVPTLNAMPEQTQAVLALSTEPLPRTVHFVLGRPIAGGTDWIDRTYAYGDTMHNSLQVHHGVEFRNPRGVPVIAAANGFVVFAGSDAGEVNPGPIPDYYGNVVIIQHLFLSPEGQPVYTLYGHLDRIEVETNQVVEQGQQIGNVGATGIAIGAHLHFEVRVGLDPFDFGATRNPEMWLYPYPNHGMIAGRVRDAQGSYIMGVAVRITSIDQPERQPIYAFTYWDDSVNRDPGWDESFTTSDLPEGQYEVLLSERTGTIRFRDTITVARGSITWVDIEVERFNNASP